MLEMLQNSTVLFACADPATKSQLYPLIKSFGFGSIVPAKDMQSANDLLRFNRLALIIADYQSDFIDGKHLSGVVRSSDTSNRKIPIILVATESDEELDESALDTGANSIVKLPVNVKTLYLTIRAVLDKIPGIIRSKNYIGPDRRNSENRPTHNEDRRREAEDYPSPLIDEVLGRTGS